MEEKGRSAFFGERMEPGPAAFRAWSMEAFFLRRVLHMLHGA